MVMATLKTPVGLAAGFLATFSAACRVSAGVFAETVAAVKSLVHAVELDAVELMQAASASARA